MHLCALFEWAIYLFLDRISCRSSWPQTSYVAKDDLQLLVLWLLPLLLCATILLEGKDCTWNLVFPIRACVTEPLSLVRFAFCSAPFMIPYLLGWLENARLCIECVTGIWCRYKKSWHSTCHKRQRKQPLFCLLSMKIIVSYKTVFNQ